MRPFGAESAPYFDALVASSCIAIASVSAMRGVTVIASPSSMN